LSQGQRMKNNMLKVTNSKLLSNGKNSIEKESHLSGKHALQAARYDQTYILKKTQYNTYRVQIF